MNMKRFKKWFSVCDVIKKLFFKKKFEGFFRKGSAWEN